jgi:uridylate kinase
MTSKKKKFKKGSNEIIIISLGGSLICPDELDVVFLGQFKKLILSHVALGKKFIVICGGGKINRRYIDVAKKLTSPKDEDLDWIGIAALKLNAELVRVIFGDKAHSKVICDLSEKFSFKKPILIKGAYKPGSSSDLGAVLAAKTFGAKKIINLSNITHVYDSDPNENPKAKKFDKISWAEYRKLIPKKWTPKLSAPFDPIASKLAQEKKIEVVVMNGHINNLTKFLAGEKFEGTVISTQG